MRVLNLFVDCTHTRNSYFEKNYDQQPSRVKIENDNRWCGKRMRFCVRWMGNCRDIGDQQELEPPPDVPPNEVRDKKRLRRPKIRPQRWPTKIKRRPEIKGDVCVEMKFAPPTFFLSSVPFRETTPILQNRKKKPTFPGKLSNKDWKTRLLFSNWTSRRWPDWLRVSSALLWSSAINLITRLQSC